MTEPSLLIEKKDHVATLTLNRPEVRNALNESLMQDLMAGLQEADEDREIRVIILQGAGDKAFCAGGDLKALVEKTAGSSVDMREFTATYGNLILTIHDLSTPIIASVQGYALAGGCGLAVAADLTIAADNARFGVPEINIGFWGAIISAPLIRAMGLKKAMDLLYTGRLIEAQMAWEMGMVTRVVPEARLQEETGDLAKTIASKSPLALQMGREMLLNAQAMDYVSSIKYLREMVTILAGSRDAREGMTAFLEKRPATWEGR